MAIDIMGAAIMGHSQKKNHKINIRWIYHLVVINSLRTGRHDPFSSIIVQSYVKLPDDNVDLIFRIWECYLNMGILRECSGRKATI